MVSVCVTHNALHWSVHVFKKLQWIERARELFITQLTTVKENPEAAWNVLLHSIYLCGGFLFVV